MLLLGVISKIKQHSSDINEIILALCVQNCTVPSLLTKFTKKSIWTTFFAFFILNTESI
jgi:hypothetical protein